MYFPIKFQNLRKDHQKANNKPFSKYKLQCVSRKKIRCTSLPFTYVRKYSKIVFDQGCWCAFYCYVKSL